MQEEAGKIVTAVHDFPADVLALSLLAQDSSFAEVSLWRVNQTKCIRLCLILKRAIKNMNSAMHKEEFAWQYIFHIEYFRSAIIVMTRTYQNPLTDRILIFLFTD